MENGSIEKEIWRLRYQWARVYTNVAFMSGLQNKYCDENLRNTIQNNKDYPDSQAC